MQTNDMTDHATRGTERYSQLLVLGGMIAVWGSLIFVIAAAIADGR
jgi:hypothetical protein